MLKVFREEGSSSFQKVLALVEIIWLSIFGVIPYCRFILENGDSLPKSIALGGAGGIALFVILTGVGSERRRER